MKVALALITDEQQRLLITQRPHDRPHGGLWEFPGGKLEAGESAEQALIREIKEEVGLEIIQYKALGIINHEYTDRAVQLIVFQVTGFKGIPCCLEGQLGMQWISIKDLDPQQFPEANHAVLDLLSIKT